MRLWLWILLLFSVECSGMSEREDGYTLSFDGWDYCPRKQKTFEEWVDYASVIFVGEAQEIRTQLPNQGYLTNNCWVKFRVDHALKGIAEKKTAWVMAAYHDYDQDAKHYRDFKNIRHCFFQKEGESYLVFGFEERNPYQTDVPHYVSLGASCTPSKPTKEARFELERMKSILKGEKP